MSHERKLTNEKNNGEQSMVIFSSSVRQPMMIQHSDSTLVLQAQKLCLTFL